MSMPAPGYERIQVGTVPLSPRLLAPPVHVEPYGRPGPSLPRVMLVLLALSHRPVIHQPNLRTILPP